MNNKLDYRFKAFQFKTSEGYSWMIKYPDLPGVVGGGDTLEEAINEGKNNIKVYLEMLKEDGDQIPAPTLEPEPEDYSGKMVLRLSKTNHMKLSEVAQNEGISINSLLNEMITEGLANRLNHKATAQIIDELRNEINLSLKDKNN